nr:winged helix-turn-helix domain-containing protein [Acidobacteriota bacterium]
MRQLSRAGEIIPLSTRPLETLWYLAANCSRSVTREELLEKIWKSVNVDPNNIDQVIRSIRQALGDDPKQPKYLKTIYGEGYRLIAPVTLIVPECPPATLPAMPIATRRRPWMPMVGVAAAVLAFLLRPELPPPRVIHSIVLTASPQTKLSPLVANSRDVFFQEKEHYGLRIAEVPVTGGDSLTLPLPVANPDLCAISPDGSTLGIANREQEGPFWLLPLRTHRPEPLGQAH